MGYYESGPASAPAGTGTAPGSTDGTRGAGGAGNLTRFTDLMVPEYSEFSVQIVANSREVMDELGKILTFVQEEELPVIAYYDSTVQNRIAGLLPAGFDLDTLVMQEMVTAQFFFYQEALGDVKVILDFAAEFQEGQILVALVGIFDEMGNVEWIPQEAEVVNVDGVNRVQVLFTKDTILKAGDKPFAFAILSE